MKQTLLLFLLLVLAAPLAGQAEPAAGHRDAAERLLDLMDMQRVTDETADAMLAMQLEHAPVMARFEDIMREFMVEHLSWSVLRPEYVRLYMELYTEEELLQLYDFYRSPLGQRVLETMPELMVRSSEISNREMQKHVPELTRRINERVGVTF